MATPSETACVGRSVAAEVEGEEEEAAEAGAAEDLTEDRTVEADTGARCGHVQRQASTWSTALTVNEK